MHTKSIKQSLQLFVTLLLLLFANTGNVWGQTDYTDRITNPSFENGDMTGWTSYGYNPENGEGLVTVTPSATNNIGWNANLSGKEGDYVCDYYSGRWTGWLSYYNIHQTLASLPSGHYELTAVLATHENKYVTLFAGPSDVLNSADSPVYANSYTVKGEGGDMGHLAKVAFDLTSTTNVIIGAGHVNHYSVWEVFFKADAFHLTYYGNTLSTGALPLPNDFETDLTLNQWYYYDAPASGSYSLVGNLKNIVYAVDATKTDASAVTFPIEATMSLSQGRVYFKKTTNEVSTLRITSIVNEGTTKTFTVCALNVDGLPKTVAGFDLNPDGPGSAGTKLISQYLAAKGYDFIGVSEDFNYHGSLMSSLTNYDSGTLRSTLSLSNFSIPFDTDGLNFIWKNNWSTRGEKWTRWNTTNDTDGNQYVKKGFRYYELDLGDGMVVDVYVLHMDAGDAASGAVDSRNAQWTQLANDIVSAANTTRPKIIIGDTNSRYTRESIKANFIDVLKSTGYYEVSDVWVEKSLGGTYPNVGDETIYNSSNPHGDYSSANEVVDKIIYINPKAANTTQLAVNTFRIESDYTYGTVQGTSDATALGDHNPLVVQFSAQKPKAQFNSDDAKYRWAWQGETLQIGTSTNYEGCSDRYWLFNLWSGCPSADRCGFLTYDGSNNPLLSSDIATAKRWSFYGSTSDLTISNAEGKRIHIGYDIFDYWAKIQDSSASHFTPTAVTKQTNAWIHSFEPYNVYPILPYNTSGVRVSESDTKAYYFDGGSVWLSHKLQWNASSNKLDGGNTNNEMIYWALISVEQYLKYLEYCKQWDKLLEYYTYLPLSSEMREEIEELLTRCVHWKSGGIEAIQAMNEEIEKWFDDDHTDKIFNPSFELDASGNPLTTTSAIAHVNGALNGWTVNRVCNTGHTIVMYKDDWRIFTPIDGNYAMQTWTDTTPPDGYFLEQEVSGLPEGFYRLTATLASYSGTTIFLTLGSKTTRCITTHAEGIGDTFDVPVFYHDGKGTVKVRVYSNTFFKADNFHLYRYDYYFDQAIKGAVKYASVAVRYPVQLPSGSTPYYVTKFGKAPEDAPLKYSARLTKYNSEYLSAGEGMLLKTEIEDEAAPRNFRLFRTTSKHDPGLIGETNKLLGAPYGLATGDMDDDYFYYGLARKNVSGFGYVVGFYRVATDDANPIITIGGIGYGKTKVYIPKNKAYIKIERVGSAEGVEYEVHGMGDIRFIFEDEADWKDTDDIEAVDEPEEHAVVKEVYSLDGTKRARMQRGINIVRLSNGKVKKVLVR